MGLHDRDYMRRGEGGFASEMRLLFSRAELPHILVAALVAAGVAQWVFSMAGFSGFTVSHLALSVEGLAAFRLWQPFSYAFVHGDGWHFLFNALGLWFLGRAVFLEDGRAGLLKTFFGGIVAGAVGWLIVWRLPAADSAVESARAGASLAGMSAGVFSLMAFHLLNKLRESFRLLIFFVIPVTLTGKTILIVSGALSFLGLVLIEVPQATGFCAPFFFPGANVSHSAHLAGLVFGFGMRLFLKEMPEIRASRNRARFTVVQRGAPRPNTAHRPPRQPLLPSAPSSRSLREEVDRVLDKINAHGFGALTRDERAVLEKARDGLRD